jgi:uncharacterized protein with von Willebrand factor type A (vWA) domain
LKIEKELAKRRMSMGGSGVKVETNVSTLIGKTTEIVAKTVGVNYKTFERAKTIIEKAPENIKEKLSKNHQIHF